MSIRVKGKRGVVWGIVAWQHNQLKIVTFYRGLHSFNSNRWISWLSHHLAVCFIREVWTIWELVTSFIHWNARPWCYLQIFIGTNGPIPTSLFPWIYQVDISYSPLLWQVNCWGLQTVRSSLRLEFSELSEGQTEGCSKVHSINSVPIAIPIGPGLLPITAKSSSDARVQAWEVSS